MVLQEGTSGFRRAAKRGCTGGAEVVDGACGLEGRVTSETNVAIVVSDAVGEGGGCRGELAGSSRIQEGRERWYAENPPLLPSRLLIREAFADGVCTQQLLR